MYGSAFGGSLLFTMTGPVETAEYMLLLGVKLYMSYPADFVTALVEGEVSVVSVGVERGDDE